MYEKRSNNLCSTYMLPLVGLNRMSFGGTNFITSYVDEDNVHVVAEVKIVTSVIQQMHCFRFEFTRDGNSYAAFEIPSILRDTVKLFREGKYSQFSDEAKSVIRKKSGLPYKVPKGTKYESARELLVLDKDKELRKAMEIDLSNVGSPVKIDSTAELASIPGEDNFFRMNMSTSISPEAVVAN